MKKSFLFFLLAIFLILGNLTTAKADTGPYYIYWTGTCWIARVYLTPGGIVYGQEIGCGNNHRMGGAYIPGNRAGLGYEYEGDARIYEIITNGTINIWQNNGTSLTLFNSGSWQFGGAPASLSQDELDAINALPSPNE